MKTKCFLFAAIAGAIFFCTTAQKNVTAENQERVTRIDSTATFAMLAFSHNDGFFATGALYDSLYDSIQYRTTQRQPVSVKNNHDQNCLFGRYDTTGNNRLVWIGYGGGKGDDAACNYFLVDIWPEYSVYIVGYFSDTALFPYYYNNEKDSGTAIATLSSKGLTDMFVARCDSRDGRMIWINGVGTPARDVALTATDTLGEKQLRMETAMIAEGNKLYVWAKCGAPLVLGAKTIASHSGNFVRFTFDRLNGVLLDADVVAAIPPH